MSSHPSMIKLKGYNVTVPGVRDANELSNSGASTVILAFLINAAVVIGSGMLAYNAGRKKRDTSSILPNQLLFKEISDLDADECVALGFCHIASLKPSKRTFSQQNLLEMIRTQPGVPLSWQYISQPKDKYQYASLLGHLLEKAKENLCKKAFPRCTMKVEEIMKLFPDSTNLCDNILQSLNALKHKYFLDDEAN